jgi:hypothetical protein
LFFLSLSPTQARRSYDCGRSGITNAADLMTLPLENISAFKPK